MYFGQIRVLKPASKSELNPMQDSSSRLDADLNPSQPNSNFQFFV